MRKYRWFERLRKSAPEPPLEPPLLLGNLSNGEMFLPYTERTRKIREMILRRADENARRIGMDRREFMTSALGMATSLAMLNVASGCSEDGEDGGFKTPSQVDCSEAEAILEGKEFILDLQTHHIDSREQWQENHPADTYRGDGFAALWAGISGCSDGADCIDTDAYFSKIFLESDTTVAVLSGFPSEICDTARLCNSLISNLRMVETRDTVNEASDETQRCVQHIQVAPNDRWDLQSRMMEEIRGEYGNHGWKCYPPWMGTSGGWFLDDPIGEQLIAKIKELGNPLLCIHKGIVFPGWSREHADPKDVGPAAVAHPDVTFVIYHSAVDGIEGFGPYDPNGGSVDRLIRTVEAHNLKGKNVYAELGAVFATALTQGPVATAHLIGKLVKHLGERNVVWGSECTWFGSPQMQIEAFRSLQISEQMQAEHGYPALTAELKANILGRNGAAIYGIDPEATRCKINMSKLAQHKRNLDGEFGKYRWALSAPDGPRSHREFQRLVKLRQALNIPA